MIDWLRLAIEMLLSANDNEKRGAPKPCWEARPLSSAYVVVLEASQLSLEVFRIPEWRVIEIIAPDWSNEPFDKRV